MSAVPCLLCGSATRSILEGLSDSRFGAPGRWSIRQCVACAFAQVDPLPDAAELKALYEAYYGSGRRESVYSRVRDFLLASRLYRIWLALDGDLSFHGERGSGRLLDVGCYEGRGLELYRRNGFRPEGLEINRRAAAEARARGFTVHEVALEALQPSRPFERIVLSNVLEHSLDPQGFVAALRRLLAPGGELWISLPNRRSWLRSFFGRAWINWHVPYHIGQYAAADLRRLLGDAGFTVISERNATPALWVAQSIVVRLSGDRPATPRRLRSPVPIAALMLLSRGLLFPLLWIGNLLCRGDCLIVKARRS